MYRLSDPPDDVPLFLFQIGRFGTGANFAVRREVIVDLGLFDERLGAGTATRGGEDLDVFFRVLASGHSPAIEPASIIWHRHRSDNDALLSQARGYGTGLGAWADQGGTGQGTIGDWPCPCCATGDVRWPEQVVPTARSRHRHRHS